MLIQRPFHFLRHGETDYNAQDRCQGQRDIALNATGRAQAGRARDILAGNSLAGPAITRIVASPLSRAAETADIVAQALGLPVSHHAGLMECGFGSFEGGQNGPWFATWLAGLPAGDAEPRAAFIERGRHAINDILGEDGHPLIVAHGGIFWSIHHHAALDGDNGLANAHPIHLTPPRDDGQGWQLRSLAP